MKQLIFALIFLTAVMIPTNGYTHMNSVEEKLAQFIGLKPVSVVYDESTRVLVVEFDDDGDPNTDGTIMLTIFNVNGLEDIRVD